MQTITLTASDGTTTPYQLKTGWEDVTVAEFVDYQTHIAKLTRVRQMVAIAAWLSDVPTDILNSDVSIAYGIGSACPWLNALPAAGGPVTDFTHAGIHYTHVGNLDTITAGQMEALLDFLILAGDNPAAAFPNLLAVLYAPVSYDQTAQSVAAAAEAFNTLPIATAWPALAFFLTSSAPSALRIQQYSTAHAETTTALKQVTAIVTERLGDSATYWQRWRWKGAALWTRCAASLLATCSPSKSFDAGN